MDFVRTFPKPTAPARRELRVGDDYPDPDDRVQVRAFHGDIFAELAALMALLQRLRSVNLRALGARRRKAAQVEAARVTRRLNSMLAAYADIYGLRAADALADAVATAVGAQEIVRHGRIRFSFAFYATGDLLAQA